MAGEYKRASEYDMPSANDIDESCTAIKRTAFRLACWCVGVRFKSHDACVCVCCESQMMHLPHMRSHCHIQAGWCVSKCHVGCVSECHVDESESESETMHQPSCVVC